MPFNHISFDDNTKYGSQLRQFLNEAEHSDDRHAKLRQLMIDMRDGDGSQAVHYAEVTKQFFVAGYLVAQGEPTAEQNAKTKALFEELDSAYSKTSGNGSVSNVRAARDQFFARLRG